MLRLRIIGRIQAVSDRYYVHGFSPTRRQLEITTELHDLQLREPVRLGSLPQPGTLIQQSDDSYDWYDLDHAGGARVVSLKCRDAMWTVTVQMVPRDRTRDSTEHRLAADVSLEEAQRLAGQPGAQSNSGVWAFKDSVISVMDDGLSHDDLLARIKHRVLREKKLAAKIAREVQAFENLDQAIDARRERIPDSVRLFVWQRDQGRCIKCGGNHKLEFDHIIPVADGGANTERNIQLLCEGCNRSKGRAL